MFYTLYKTCNCLQVWGLRLKFNVYHSMVFRMWWYVKWIVANSQRMLFCPNMSFLVPSKIRMIIEYFVTNTQTLSLFFCCYFQAFYPWLSGLSWCAFRLKFVWIDFSYRCWMKESVSSRFHIILHNAGNQAWYTQCYIWHQLMFQPFFFGTFKCWLCLGVNDAFLIVFPYFSLFHISHTLFVLSFSSFLVL